MCVFMCYALRVVRAVGLWCVSGAPVLASSGGVFAAGGVAANLADGGRLPALPTKGVSFDCAHGLDQLAGTPESASGEPKPKQAEFTKQPPKPTKTEPSKDESRKPTKKPEPSQGESRNPTKKPEPSQDESRNPTKKPEPSQGESRNPTKKPEPSQGESRNPTKKPEPSQDESCNPTKKPEPSQDESHGASRTTTSPKPKTPDRTPTPARTESSGAPPESSPLGTSTRESATPGSSRKSRPRTPKSRRSSLRRGFSSHSLSSTSSSKFDKYYHQNLLCTA